MPITSRLDLTVVLPVIVKPSTYKVLICVSPLTLKFPSTYRLEPNVASPYRIESPYTVKSSPTVTSFGTFRDVKVKSIWLTYNLPFTTTLLKLATPLPAAALMLRKTVRFLAISTHPSILRVPDVILGVPAVLVNTTDLKGLSSVDGTIICLYSITSPDTYELIVFTIIFASAPGKDLLNCKSSSLVVIYTLI